MTKKSKTVPQVTMEDVWKKSREESTVPIAKEMHLKYNKTCDAVLGKDKRDSFARMVERYQEMLPSDMVLSADAETVLRTALDLFPLELLQSAVFSSSQIRVNPGPLTAGQWVPATPTEAWMQSASRKLLDAERRQAVSTIASDSSSEEEEEEEKPKAKKKKKSHKKSAK